MNETTQALGAALPEQRVRALLDGAAASEPFAAPGLDLSRLDCSRDALALQGPEV